MSVVSFTEEAPRIDDYEVVGIDGGEIADRDGLMDALTDALGLADWFGRNWDALNDVLHDADLRNSAEVVVVTDATALWRNHPRMAGALVELWLECEMQLVFEW